MDLSGIPKWLLDVFASGLLSQGFARRTREEHREFLGGIAFVLLCFLLGLALAVMWLSVFQEYDYRSSAFGASSGLVVASACAWSIWWLNFGGIRRVTRD